MTREKSLAGWYFLGVIILIYVIVFFINSSLFLSALHSFIAICRKVIPVIILVFILMVITNYALKPQLLVKHLGKDAGVKGWLIAIIAGILSSGPIYLWYPLLHELQKRGVRNGLLAVFLYNRAVKIPLLPLLIAYFGVAYTVILTLVMILFSVIQGVVVEKIVGVKS